MTTIDSSIAPTIIISHQQPQQQQMESTVQHQTTPPPQTNHQTPSTTTTTNNNDQPVAGSAGTTTPSKPHFHHHYTSSGGNGLLSAATTATNSFVNNTPCTPSVVSSSLVTTSKSQSNLGMGTAVGGNSMMNIGNSIRNNQQQQQQQQPIPAASSNNGGGGTNQMNLCGFLLKNRWKIQGLLGQGSFGSIYSAHDLVTSEEVAIKIEKVQSPTSITNPQQQPQNGGQPQPVTPQASSLKVEVCALKNLQNCRYVVTYIHSGRQYITYGTENVALNFLVMERLGENLAELRRKNANGVFNLTTTMRCGVQMIDCIEEIHKSGFLHRDVKPANFVTGRTRNARGRIFVIDFGLARAYKHEDGNLKPPRNSCGFRGTPRYASINAHNGLELSRRDDLWSIFYVMVEMASGNLPWRRMRDKAVIGKLKEQHTIQNSSELLKGLPQQFVTMLNYLKTLKFESEPDYVHLKSICKSFFAPHKDAQEFKTYEECQFEWIVKNSDENTNSSSLENANNTTSTTNPDRTDSKSRTGKLSTSVFFGSTRLSTVSNANLGSNALVGSQQEFSKSLPDMSKKRGDKGDGDEQGNDREGKQPHCKCSIM